MSEIRKFLEIGKSVKAARERSGYTQERLAELTDVSPQYISSVERGVVGISITVLQKLSKVLLVSCDVLVMGDVEASDVSGITSRLSRLPVEHVKNAEALLDRYVEGIAISTKHPVI